jgi:DNA-binding response OmpR family regulator
MVKEAESVTPAVLVVDANPTHCLLYQMEMEARGYEVVCTGNGHEALTQIQHRHFDVAVVDAILPDIKGSELVKEISTSCQNLPIILNTAYPYSKNQIRHWAIDAFVLKSSDLRELIGKITRLLKRNSHYHRATAIHAVKRIHRKRVPHVGQDQKSQSNLH